ncbi:aspartate aminotransferase family protein [Rhodococcus wratislaviensis]|uniref:Putative aminotransferase n=1 Tax=Rhodococcus wratislaviensis NBRC 100605 TaxID=1219028 RepID=X0Q0K3_RHOWR|nr:aspartate aminotransferase family protein [Rhodococcus wratislaviensis]GAF43681.1 putative aminotransferase [Rhodococcus wratislaviensis NBRC 100605]
MSLTATTATKSALQVSAERHLWMNFSHLGHFADGRTLPIMVKGAGCYVWDEHGKKYLDSLSSLFCVNIGHGRPEVTQAGADQGRELEYYPTWDAAHPPAIKLAEKIASLAPGDLNRVFFTSGGSESVDSALKLARQYHKMTGNERKTKIVARSSAYHGTTMGALALTGIPAVREPFEPFTPGGCHVPNSDVYRLPEGVSPASLAEAFKERIEFEGPDTVAAVIVEPVQTAGGCYMPATENYFERIREICDEYNVLMISDEVICSWGRIGEWFGCQRFGYLPDMITTAKGLTSAYAPMGAVIIRDKICDPFLEGDNSFLHGFTFAGHPVSAAIALANIEVFEKEDLLGNVRRNESVLRGMLESLRDLELVGDVRGTGYFQAIELVADKATKARFAPEVEAQVLKFFSEDLLDRGLIVRVDDRAGVVLQFAPPLIAGPEQFAELEAILRPSIAEAAARFL